MKWDLLVVQTRRGTVVGDVMARGRGFFGGGQ